MDNLYTAVEKREKTLQQGEADKPWASYFIAASMLNSFREPLFNAVSAPLEALVCWENYQKTGDEQQREKFFEYAHWLVEHETRIESDAGGWPISVSHPLVATVGAWLSALIQGVSLSILTRAYHLTHEGAFLQVAKRVTRTFELDILDGGVSAPIGSDGKCFEEVGVYPSSHMLGGFICGLYGLYDYVTITGDSHLEYLIQCSHSTLHRLLPEFDTGYWTRANLLQRDLTSMRLHTLQTALLKGFASQMQCEVCITCAKRWERYHSSQWFRLRAILSKHWSHICRTVVNRIRMSLFPKVPHAEMIHVGIPIVGFPVMGGTRGVLAGIAQVMEKIWHIEYVTQFVGPHSEGYMIHRFGKSWAHPWQFPAVWLYCLAGGKKLLSLFRHKSGYQVLLPQDGVFSAAFASLVGKIVGARVVAIDHGNLSLLDNRNYRAERIQNIQIEPWSRPRRLIAHLQFYLYWPSLKLLAWIASHCVDHYLIPGVEGDDETEACARLGIGASRVTRFASMLDTNNYSVPNGDEKSTRRAQHDILPGAIVIALVCRLAPEKGVDTALEALGRTLSALAPERRTRVQVIVAGDGPLRQHMETLVRERGLNQVVTFWGETPNAKVKELLCLSDIFLYTSVRGACLSIAILEAMASGCAIVASPLPQANVHMLAKGRGIIVPVGDAVQTGEALTHLVNDLELCQRMGRAARDYVKHYHSPEQFRRTLIRVTGWSSLDDILGSVSERK